MFRLRRRTQKETRDGRTERGGTPSYRRDDGAVEYRTEDRGPKRERLEGGPDHSGEEDARGRFHPLPRCPSCKTAIGFEQSECHSCGRGLKKV